MIELPIDAHMDRIRQAFAASPNLVIEATPGSGKTTRVPPAIMNLCKGEVLVLEPRRLAARLSAERVAAELGESVGGRIGYQVRFEKKISASTRLKFLTEGLLLRLMMESPNLDKVSAVILDEFHERHLHTDTALGLLRLLQRKKRPDLKIIIMSATLDVESLVDWLGTTSVVRVEAPRWPVGVEWLEPARGEFLEKTVRRGVQRALELAPDGHVLVFLPGAADISRSATEIQAVAKTVGAVVLELRGELSRQDQDRVFSDLGRRKIILSTNIAETSLTIDGVKVVVDSGLAKIPSFAPWSGMPTLTVRPISRASTIQRAGRAGRTSAGTVIRLYAERDWLARHEFEKPEIERLDLTQMLLDTTHVAERMQFDFADISLPSDPPPGSMDAARKLLQMLGAMSHDAKLTPLGRQMAQLPLHPRLSRLVFAGIELGVADAALMVGALLSDGSSRFLKSGSQPHDCQALVGLRELRRQRDDQIVRRIFDMAAQSARLCGLEFNVQKAADPNFESWQQTLIAAFPDRVAKKRIAALARSDKAGVEYNLSLGGGAVWQDGGPDAPDWILILDAEERLGTIGSKSVVIRLLCPLNPDLLMLGSDFLLKEQSILQWDDGAGRVRSLNRIMWGELVLEETRTPGEASRMSEVLFEALQSKWPKPFESGVLFDELGVRLELMMQHAPQDDSISLQGLDFSLREFLRWLAQGRTSFKECTELELDEWINAWLDELKPGLSRRLGELFPLFVLVGAGRRVRINYERGQSPWIASRLQDFFGQAKSPAVCAGRLRLTVHLLAPNQRAVQITQDLESFWRHSYQTLRRELSRNYPRHWWPEDPMQAEPPPLRPPRRP
jgi:ATP-dependent helicase HrpB